MKPIPIFYTTVLKKDRFFITNNITYENTFVLLSFCLTSCATLFSGTSDDIHFETKPEKAKVSIDGRSCRTPCTLYDVGRQLGSKYAQIKSDGYETENFALRQSINGVAFLNFFNLLGWGIDVATGAIKRYDPVSYNIELEKKK